MTLFRIAVRVAVDDAERARAAMLDISPHGFEEVSVGETVELAAYGDAALVETVREAFGDVTAVGVEPGWEDGWRAFHEAVTVAGIWIGPPWLQSGAGTESVVIDPGRAFGTGAHPTTRLCVELLTRVERGSLLDVGCGSGVLAITARRLGFDPVIAIDDDPVAVEVTAENALRNGVAVDARGRDAITDVLPTCDVVVANISLATVETMLHRVDARHAVTSGYLETEQPNAGAWRLVETVTTDGWRADLLARA